MRAILLASATRTSIGGLRDSIPASQVPGRAEEWTWRLMMTLLAPRISRRRRDRSPILVVARHRHQPPGDVIFLGATGDLRIELGDLCLQVRECRDQSLQRRDGIRQAGHFPGLPQSRSGVWRWMPLGSHDLPELGQMAA